MFLKPADLIPDASTGLHPIQGLVRDQNYADQVHELLGNRTTNPAFLSYHAEELTYRNMQLSGEIPAGHNPKIAFLAWEQVKSYLGQFLDYYRVYKLNEGGAELPMDPEDLADEEYFNEFFERLIKAGEHFFTNAPKDLLEFAAAKITIAAWTQASCMSLDKK